MKRLFYVIGVLLILEAAYRAFTSYAWTKLYMYASGSSRSIEDFIAKGFATSVAWDALVSVFLVIIGINCIAGERRICAIVSWASPLILIYGAWVSVNSTPAIMSWMGVLQGDQVALSALAGIIFCAIGLLGLQTLWFRLRKR